MGVAGGLRRTTACINICLRQASILVRMIIMKLGRFFSSYFTVRDELFYEAKEHDIKLSNRSLVWHVVEHQARHRGQIFMLMRMQGLEVPHV
jgi:hypothetical protein